jgi:hypothetical protein
MCANEIHLLQRRGFKVPTRRLSNIRTGDTDTGTEEAPTPYRVALNALGLTW